MAPKDRFEELKNKGYYLFLGASKDKGKHHDKICQRSFVCKHKPHDKYPIKKHNLVCHEHRNDTKCPELCQKYKDRFIMKQTNQLPSFSRDLNQNSLQILKKCLTKRR